MQTSARLILATFVIGQLSLSQTLIANDTGPRHGKRVAISHTKDKKKISKSLAVFFFGTFSIATLLEFYEVSKIEDREGMSFREVLSAGKENVLAEARERFGLWRQTKVGPILEFVRRDEVLRLILTPTDVPSVFEISIGVQFGGRNFIHPESVDAYAPVGFIRAVYASSGIKFFAIDDYIHREDITQKVLNFLYELQDTISFNTSTTAEFGSDPNGYLTHKNTPVHIVFDSNEVIFCNQLGNCPCFTGSGSEKQCQTYLVPRSGLAVSSTKPLKFSLDGKEIALELADFFAHYNISSKVQLGSHTGFVVVGTVTGKLPASTNISAEEVRLYYHNDIEQRRDRTKEIIAAVKHLSEAVFRKQVTFTLNVAEGGMLLTNNNRIFLVLQPNQDLQIATASDSQVFLLWHGICMRSTGAYTWTISGSENSYKLSLRYNTGDFSYSLHISVNNTNVFIEELQARIEAEKEAGKTLFANTPKLFAAHDKALRNDKTSEILRFISSEQSSISSTAASCTQQDVAFAVFSRSGRFAGVLCRQYKTVSNPNPMVYAPVYQDVYIPAGPAGAQNQVQNPSALPVMEQDCGLRTYIFNDILHQPQLEPENV